MWASGSCRPEKPPSVLPSPGIIGILPKDVHVTPGPEAATYTFWALHAARILGIPSINRCNGSMTRYGWFSAVVDPSEKPTQHPSSAPQLHVRVFRIPTANNPAGYLLTFQKWHVSCGTQYSHIQLQSKSQCMWSNSNLTCWDPLRFIEVDSASEC